MTTACQHHNLWHAVSLAPSWDDRYVYCRCGCGRFRQVPRAAWEAELQRRQQAQQCQSLTTERNRA